ncbi:bifunctional cobalt-precorrin-7 (C(5))-methyltransferase/cobalt-precorrin-6B (C(15))-methyltransferase [Jonquetella anthropi]|uniref:bifunctional cobalt-precorrin-7 (C(5))-methyltransferase/cobalt-precorrin-6B (C(15))-methyltransferase n=1 Tax=Jonquetella anthropi TaxID=428712 RepID=UPI0001B911B7|nr:bifunctional cobalt-precorrin-7 (C(5))-methyltransferase/cobalt-precorrin-6B (C(15))-methyltransferase [Jonquetella anthropi]EEX49234.1 precorrin-6Y C5,15-methyltransferase (decarboxylating), CbiT subunit [Jonquetella anthropi E3_33 E1]
MGKLFVIGAGPGNPGGVPLRCLELARSLPKVYAFDRPRRLLSGLLGRPVEPFGPKLDPSLDELEWALAEGDVGLLVTGDPCLFSLLDRLRKRFGPDAMEVLPASGALQSLFAKLKEPWEGAVVLSGHGRDLTGERLAGTVKANRLTVLFCDKDHTPAWACRVLEEFGLGGVSAAAGERLDHDDERIASGAARDLADLPFGGMSVARFLNGSPSGRFWPGLKDESFTRGHVPMTKRFVRAQILSLLAPQPGDVLWDVGAGTGSVSVELALAAPEGIVWAVEREPEGIELIRANAAALRAYNVKVVAGTAPEALEALPSPDRVFVGGSSGNLDEILQAVAARGAGISVVVSSATIETSAQAARCLVPPLFVGAEAVTLSVTEHQKIGRVHLNRAQNPVTLWYAVTAEETGK